MPGLPNYTNRAVQSCSNQTPLPLSPFHHLQVQEADAPSFFNPIEASTVVELVANLLAEGRGITTDDVGVIATYRKQVGGPAMTAAAGGDSLV